MVLSLLREDSGMKLKDNKWCQKGHIPGHVPEVWEDDLPYRLCRKGTCVEILCPGCGLMMGGWGSVFCPCENGRMRWLKYPDMDVKPHPAVKESKRGNRRPVHVRSWYSQDEADKRMRVLMNLRRVR
jgi:hypothetical protein